MTEMKKDINNETIRLSFRELLSKYIVEIPMIQRAYAQGRTDARTTRTRERFLEAIKEHILSQKPMVLDFIFGKKEQMEHVAPFIPLDGQQRLTTLFLLHWYAAKKERRATEDYQFLSKFHYRTRESARVFLEKLISFDPSQEDFSKLSDAIVNQYWYAPDWKNDATIAGMLVMLDCIHDKFSGVANLWDALDTICFYFKDIEALGLTDEVYIKMNSRGKELSLFEHFKAELEKVLRDQDIDENIRNRIAFKIDREWTDIMWHYRDKEREDKGDVGDMFLNFFHFVCDVICYKSGDSAVSLGQADKDAIDLIKIYFKEVSRQEAEHAILLLESYLDAWCRVSDIKAFWEQLFSVQHDPARVMLYEDRDVDLLQGLLKGEFAHNKYPGRFVMFYAVQLYLLNRESKSISLSQIVRRLRIINNLIFNSSDVADRPGSATGNRLPAVLEQTEKIILSEEIATTTSYERGGYAKEQIEEELQKQSFLRSQPQYAEELFKLEDHQLLKGHISIVGLDDPALFGKFHALFDCDWDKVDCALLSIGDYSQRVNSNSVIYSLGTSDRGKARCWRQLLTASESNRYGYENTKRCLHEVLRYDEINDALLDKIIADYLKSCEDSQQYDWRYYYIKYPSFRPGAFGKFYRMKDAKYHLAIMKTESAISNRTYDAYLFEAIGKVNTNNYGLSVTVADKYELYCTDKAFILRDDDDTIIDSIDIDIDEATGLDSENRVEAAKRAYEQFCSEHK